MSGWLAKARAARSRTARNTSEACANCANCAKTPPDPPTAGGFGTNGTIGTGSSISEEEIRSRLTWTAQRLREEHGRAPWRAREEAVAIVRADLLNDARLASTQADPRQCLVCGLPGSPSRVLVPVLTARKDDVVWLHLQPCHEAHILRRRREVDDLIRAAGSSEGMNLESRGEGPARALPL
jgi:hypothetical protein